MINDSAAVIILDIAHGIRFRRDIEGGEIRRLKASTIRAKIRKGSKKPTTPLVDTGIMTKLPPYTKATPTSHKAIIRIAKSRLDIGQYQMDGTKTIPSRKWFGISDRADRIARSKQMKKLAEILRKVWL